MRVTNSMPLGRPLPLTIAIVNGAASLKVPKGEAASFIIPEGSEEEFIKLNEYAGQSMIFGGRGDGCINCLVRCSPLSLATRQP
jgi:hypothetical protein